MEEISLLSSPVTMQANLESLVGTLVSVMPTCPLAPLHYRVLQRILLKSLRSGRNKSKLVSLSSRAARIELCTGGAQIQVSKVTVLLLGIHQK